LWPIEKCSAPSGPGALTGPWDRPTANGIIGSSGVGRAERPSVTAGSLTMGEDSNGNFVRLSEIDGTSAPNQKVVTRRVRALLLGLYGAELWPTRANATRRGQNLNGQNRTDRGVVGALGT
jgi:hypothetical protein